MTILITIAILGAIFYLLAILTEEYFVPAIDKLAHKMRLSSDAAGATLLAMGSSAPEFFTSLFAVLGLAGGGHADVGAGTIVGSAIFNVLVIVGVAATFRAVTLQWKPVIRDIGFYIITILMLLWSFWDGKIELYEAVLFVIMYCVYVFFAVNWRKWLKYKETPAPQQGIDDTRTNPIHKTISRAIGWIIPNPAKHPRLYVATFLLSIGAIAGLSWVLVEQIILLANTLDINPTFLALTVLAAGTSIPDLIGSIVVAKQGRGDMAVSNAIGSNVFDILFGLGLPWVIVLALQPHQSISVSTDNLLASIFLLFATVVAILFLLVIRNWKIGHRSGLILIGLYIAYCIYIATTVA
jgi:K+-dependent Na+/Ca+ exchanger-like protein